MGRSRSENHSRRVAAVERSVQLGSWACDLASGSLTWSPQTLRILGLHAETAPLLLEDCLQLLHPADRETAGRLGEEAVRTGQPVEACLRICPPDGTERLVLAQAQTVRDRAGVPLRACGTVLDVTGAGPGEDPKRGTANGVPSRVGKEPLRRIELLRLQSEVLQMIAVGAELEDTLSALCLIVEHVFEKAACSIMLLDADTGCLTVAVGPSLSQELISSLNGLRPGELAGWCGAAALGRETEKASERTARPRRPSFQVVRDHGVGACWSTPILSESETMIGSFLITHFVPRTADEHDRQLLETSSHLASIAMRRHRGEKELRESEERYRNMFQNAAVAMWELELSPMHAAIDELKRGGVTDFRGYLGEHPEIVERATGLLWAADVNSAAVAMYGAETGEELRQDLDQVLVPESVAGVREVLVGLAEGSSQVEVETVHRSLDGRAIDVLIRMALPLERSALGRALMSLIDITDRKSAEKEREELIAELERKNAELERFAYTVSHDLKSPLFTIIGFLGLLRKDAAAGDTERLKGDIERIRGATETMGRLLDELLELSRAGRLPTPKEAVLLEELVREAMLLLEEKIAERGIVVDISSDLPVVLADRVWLVKVVQNLIDNAVKYMGAQDKPFIEIGTVPSDEENVCFVRDNGLGVDSRYHEKIFGLFERVELEPEGPGIGLALCRRVVEAHGGRLWIESDGRGRGSTFFFSLPWCSQPGPP